MMFPFAFGDTVLVHVYQKVARECYVARLKFEPTNIISYRESLCGRSREYKIGRSPRSRGSTRDQSRERRSPIKENMVTLVDLEPWLNDTHIESGEDLHPLPLRGEENTTHIGSSLQQTDKKLMSQTLVENADLFAWTTSDMSEISSNVITHHLLVYKEVRSVAQKRRKMG